MIVILFIYSFVDEQQILGLPGLCKRGVKKKETEERFEGMIGGVLGKG